ncbi:MAG: type III-A CRISPR-associated RAMP protein Csm4 [Deltaproteobacteria bacterium]|nr:type III-A CRISPR-associated RAMP protein Csm4 [Deltaproteobacteria bacterium]
MRVFRLKFHSALHVDSKGSGEPEVAEEFIHSDTVSAALCLAWSSLYRDTQDEFFLNPPFRVSSAFPYIGDILLFPAPAWNCWKEDDPVKRKETKKVRWISRELFELVLSGHSLDFSQAAVITNNVAVSRAEAEANPELRKVSLWAIIERQRVSVDRLGIPGEGGLFSFALQFFSQASGLYILADVPDEQRARFRSALGYLGDCGIGADRNSGLGHFKVVDETEFSISLPARAEAWITLSLFNPGPDNDILTMTRQAAYGLLTRSGWISGTTIGRPPIRVFVEGSCFSEKPVGRVVPMLSADVREKYGLQIDHCAARDFRSISLPCVKPAYLEENS